jgi:hypothetical protein
MSVTRIVAGLAGLLSVGIGLWAIIDARSFFELSATYPPFNEHLLRDIGAFNVGLGAVLLLALVWSDALLVALAGVGMGAAAHALNHWLDTHLGGTPLDPWYMTVFAVVVLAGAALRWREVGRAQRAGR